MGTDMHTFIEYKANDLWRPVCAIPEGPPESTVLSIIPFEINPYEYSSDRNYALFAILAGVRNDSMYGDPITPISGPRGLPKDLSTVLRDHFNSCSDFYHSETYYGLKEIIDFPWEKRNLVKRGVVNVEGFASFIKRGEPENYSAAVYRNALNMVSIVEMHKVLYKHMKGHLSVEDKERTYCEVTWGVSFKDIAKDFINDIVGAMKRIATEKTEGDLTRVRVVLGFDS